ncbi:MAG TPA: hemerythrin family protein [Anaeromyxobacter sp.]|nr:hemerythrin family protein [Anaeromyxobacter sp.]
MSSSIQWSPSLAVGVAEIDAQHQELFRRAERLITALRAGDRQEVEPLVRYLTDYVVEHFSAEERYMREIGYPGLEGHREAHQKFRDDFAEMVADYQRKGPTPLVALTMHNWLSDWLRRHVAGLDQDIGRYADLKRRG